MLENLTKSEIDTYMQKQKHMNAKLLKQIEKSVSSKWRSIKRPHSNLDDNWYKNIEDDKSVANLNKNSRSKLNFSSLSDNKINSKIGKRFWKIITTNNQQ